MFFILQTYHLYINSETLVLWELYCIEYTCIMKVKIKTSMKKLYFCLKEEFLKISYLFKLYLLTSTNILGMPIHLYLGILFISIYIYLI